MRTIVVTVLVLTCLMLTNSADAQGRRPRRGAYVPSRPTISPYLYLSRGNTGGLPSYYAWVRPQIEYQQQQQFVERELRYLEGEATRPQVPVVGRPSTAATYMNYSHFYPQLAPGR